MKQMYDFLRKNLPAYGLGLITLGLPAYFVREQSEVDRQQSMKQAEYTRFVDETQKFHEALQQFSFDLATKGKVDKAKVNEMSISLVRQYANADAFIVNIPINNEPSFAAYKTSLVGVKASLQAVKAKKDLEPLGTSVLDMERKLKAIRPIMEAAVGKPEKLSIR